LWPDKPDQHDQTSENLSISQLCNNDTGRSENVISPSGDIVTEIGLSDVLDIINRDTSHNGSLDRQDVTATVC